MRNAEEVLMMKERELQKVKKEIEALRITAKLLGEDQAPAQGSAQKPTNVVELP